MNTAFTSRPKPSFRRMVAAALAVGVSVALGAAPAQSAGTVTVRAILRTQAAVTDAVGSTVSIIQACPVGATLDRRMTRALVSPTPSNYRLLSRELWPRGLVTRWRQTRPRPQVDNFPLPTQTVVCVQGVPAAATRHTMAISAIVRLWGPAPWKAELDSIHDPAGTWGARQAKATIGFRGLTSRRMVFATGAADFPDQAFAGGFILGPYPAGRYAELTVFLSVTTYRP
ncbi:hypothetical protein [Nostocoides sp. HKS02]|uniref:hypothetical protein n=1 Tax=Nostocoides sp. HKS02 TaxID=1813880 RepID=UPI0012B452BD|nr:hypothetical protein [Tetrasphaera sp. HKS02]QGN58887.1 hypothetical protein GKE56_14450 [Tetrasphaera sp. HKS02]